MRTRVLDFRSNEGKDFRSNESFRRNGSNHPLPLVITDHCSFHMIRLPLDCSSRKRILRRRSDKDSLFIHSSMSGLFRSGFPSEPILQRQFSIRLACQSFHLSLWFLLQFNSCSNLIRFAVSICSSFSNAKKTSKKMRHLGFSYI